MDEDPAQIDVVHELLQRVRIGKLDRDAQQEARGERRIRAVAAMIGRQ